tara:strand:+ start:1708 stop:2094 length:387 start_codon:yes stop_codon:yes gene_type:complete
VNVPLVTVLSEPKSIAQTAGSPVAESLNIKQPLAVKDADVKLVSAKSQTAVVLSATGVTLVRAFPFAVYPDPDTSFDVVYAVVDAPKEAELVYRAKLKVFPEDAVKSCTPFKISTLKLVQIADVIAII